MTEIDEQRVLFAIKACVDRLSQATPEKPFPAKGINLVIDAGDLATQENAETLRRKYNYLFDDLKNKLGYQRGYLVNTESSKVILLFGTVNGAENN